MTTTPTAAPLSAEQPQRFNNIAGLMNPTSNGLYVRYEEHVSLIAQARAAGQAEPVAWLEAEPSARGQDPRNVAWSMLYSSRIHTMCAPMTSNPVWPLYAAPQATAPQPSVGEQADERALFKAWWAKRVPAGSDSDHAAIFAFEVWQAARAPSPSREEAPAAQAVEAREVTDDDLTMLSLHIGTLEALASGTIEALGSNHLLKPGGPKKVTMPDVKRKLSFVIPWLKKFRERFDHVAPAASVAQATPADIAQSAPVDGAEPSEKAAAANAGGQMDALEDAAKLAIKFTAIPRDVLGPATPQMKALAAVGEKIAAAIRAIRTPAADAGGQALTRWMHDGGEMAISPDGDWVDYDAVLALHRMLAGETLRANQGWERAEAKARECNELRERMARAATSAGGLKGGAQ